MGATLDGPGLFVLRCPLPAYFGWRVRDLPGSWGTLAYMPRSSTPADHSLLATTGRAMLPSAQKTTSAPQTCFLSRLNHAACTLLLAVAGGATTVVEEVAPVVGSTDRGGAHFAVSETGSLFYLSGGLEDSRLVWVDRQGVSEPLAAPPAFYAGARISPDGTRLAIVLKGDVWLYGPHARSDESSDIHR